MFICVVKQVIGAVKGVGSKKDIQRSNHRGMKVKLDRNENIAKSFKRCGD